jgi:uncharacterized protein
MDSIIQPHPDIPIDRWQEIQFRLNRIETDFNVTFLIVVESGSRAWGFPSPDSDFDVRFIYVNKRNEYLRLQSPRDVIETPIEGDMDINGWDIKKSLLLLLKSNAVANEWLQSPIRYRRDHGFVPALQDFATSVLDTPSLAFHYSNLCQRVVQHWLEGTDALPIKKYFYALRPALALRFLRLNEGVSLPMALTDLLQGAALPPPLEQMIGELCAEKRQTRELGIGRRLPLLDELIFGELEMATALMTREKKSAAAFNRADDLFRALLDQTDKTERR